MLKKQILDLLVVMELKVIVILQIYLRAEDKIVRIRRTGKWILLESLNKEVRKLSCDATKNDLNLLECSVIIQYLQLKFGQGSPIS